MTTIASAINRRGVTEVLHFTTNEGLVGILASGALKSRASLPEEKHLEFVYTPNCVTRHDHAWLDFVNLSITAINVTLFDISSNKWHQSRDVWWCALSFSPDILLHEKVYFATTNNKYASCKRDSGLAGFEALFASQVRQFPNKIIRRSPSAADNRPTCGQAEVLYPTEVSIQYLQNIYVATREHLDIVHAQCDILGVDGFSVLVKPGVFK